MHKLRPLKAGCSLDFGLPKSCTHVVSLYLREVADCVLECNVTFDVCEKYLSEVTTLFEKNFFS